MTSSVNHHATEKGKMGFWAILFLTVGTQLGSGMLMLPAQLSPFGVWGILSWGVTGMGALVLSLIFSDLSGAIPRTGGVYLYAEEAFGPRVAFLTAWMYWFLSWGGLFPLLIIGTKSIGAIMGRTFSLELMWAIQFFTLLGIAGSNLLGTRVSGIVSVVFGILKIVPLLAVPILGILCGTTNHIHVPSGVSPWVAIHGAGLFTLWGFLGLESGVTPAGEVKHPTKTIPRALFFGSLLVTAIYALNTGAIMGVIPADKLVASELPYADFVGATLGGKYEILTHVFIAFLCLGTLASWMLSTGQSSLGAAEDGFFPRLFARKNRWGSPTWGILIQVALLCLVTFPLTYFDIHKDKYASFNAQLNVFIQFTCVTMLVMYLMCVGAFVKFMLSGRLKQTSGRWGLAGLGIVFCVWSVVAAGWQDVAIIVAILALLLCVPSLIARIRRL